MIKINRKACAISILNLYSIDIIANLKSENSFGENNIQTEFKVFINSK